MYLLFAISIMFTIIAIVAIYTQLKNEKIKTAKQRRELQAQIHELERYAYTDIRELSELIERLEKYEKKLQKYVKE